MWAVTSTASHWSTSGSAPACSGTSTPSSTTWLSGSSRIGVMTGSAASRRALTIGLLVVGSLALLAIAWSWVVHPLIAITLTERAIATATDRIVDRSGAPRLLVQAVLGIVLVPYAWALGQLIRFGIWEAIQTRILGRPPSMWHNRSLAALVL